jgi:pyruvate,water dikinase
MVRRPLRTAGLDALAELPVLRHHASHVYVNANLLAEVIRRLPAGLRSEGLLDLLPESVRRRLDGGASWVTGTLEALMIAERAWRREPAWAPWERAAAFDRECVEVRRGFRNPGTFGAEPSTRLGAAADRPAEPDAVAALRADLIHVAERLGHYLDVVSWGMVFAYVFYHLLHELCRRWAPGLEPDHAALTVGLPGIASLDAHYDLRALTPLLAAEPALAPALSAGDFATAARILAADAGAAGRAYRSLVAVHGHRLTGRDLACPTWAEVPGLVVELAAPGHAAASALLERAAVVRRRLEATARVERAFGGWPLGPARRLVFGLVLAEAQRYYALRENMRYHADFFLARLRAIALGLGADLAARGRLAAATDAFWLDVHELTADDPGTLGERVAARRAAAQRDAAAPPPETLDAHAAPPARPAADAGVLSGEVGAPGRCSGIARIVREPADFERVAAGDVLVAVYTDPGWTTVLERAAGLVLEAGGVLSHGAIVARELGIPALVGVAGATQAIRDGDPISIDAGAGRVTVTPSARR